MAKVEKFEYTLTKEIGTIGCKDDKSYMSVELGHYNDYADKIYIFSRFKKRDGSDDSRVVAKFTIDEFNALKEMEV